MIKHALALLLSILIFASPALAETVLRVAVEDHYPPYSFKETDGKMAGFNVDIANALAETMNMKCEIIGVAWGDILPRLKADEYDAIVACMAIKPERLKYADFTNYYLKSKTGFIGKNTLPQDISPKALAGKRLASQRQTTQYAYLEKTYGAIATIVPTTTMEEAYIALADGDVDLVLTVLLAGLEFLKTPKGQELDMIGPALTEQEFDSSPGYIAVQKGNKELTKKLNDALRIIRTNGTYAKIGQKYFPFSPY